MTPPNWVLTLAFWLHMLATVIWIGGLAALALLVIPAGRKSLAPADFYNLLDRVQARLDPLGWFSLALLVVTGLIQMTANPNYAGLVAVQNTWSLAILIKHLVFIGMVIASAYLTWGVLPRLRRAALRRAHGGMDTGSERSLRAQEVQLLRLNVILSALILVLTALARTA